MKKELNSSFSKRDKEIFATYSGCLYIGKPKETYMSYKKELTNIYSYKVDTSRREINNSSSLKRNLLFIPSFNYEIKAITQILQTNIY